MVPYWLGFDFLFRRLVMRVAKLSTCCALLILLALPPWLALVVPGLTGGDESAWYATHSTGALNDETDFAVVLLKFHPVRCKSKELVRVRVRSSQPSPSP